LFGDRQSDFDVAAAKVALNHHEKWNGTGYPGYIDLQTGAPLSDRVGSDGAARGKKGEEIPLFGRIVALTDVFDALSSKRCYKEAWDESQVLKTIEQDAGSHFDPELVEIFFSSLKMIRAIQERYQDEPED
jgi:HD-GYP domain-containing protein (c-di-GMP phosphodiesterase class II)